MASSNSSDTQRPVFWERLRGLFTREEPADGEQRRRYVAIAVCFLISCVLWLAFTLQDTHTVTMQIPTVVQNRGGDQALTSLPPKNVEAQIEGEGTVLLRFYGQEPRIAIGADNGQVNVNRLLAAELPRGVRLKGVSPTVLNLEREPRLTRTVPVRLRGTVATPATHALMDPPAIQPDSVQISGARSLVQSIEAWPTEPVNITGLKDSLRRRIPLADTLSGLVARSIGSVMLTAQSRQFTEGMRTIEVRVTGGPENAVTLDPSSLRVRYRTLVEQHPKADKTDAFYATVSYGQIRADTTGQVEPRIHTPPELVIRDVKAFPSALRYYNFVANEQ